MNAQPDSSVSCCVTSEESIAIHPSFTSSSLPHHHHYRHHHQQLQQQPAGHVHVDELVTESVNVAELPPTIDDQKVLEYASVDLDFRPSARSDVEQLRRRVSAEAPEPDRTQIVVEVHPTALNGKSKVRGDRGTAPSVRSSAPELHFLTSTALEADDTDTSEPRRKRQFVVVAVADDVVRLSKHAGVHRAASGVRRSGSCTLPITMRSPTTTRRYVISLSNLDTGKSGSDAVLTQCHSSSPTSSQRASSTIASAGSSDQAASVTVALEAPTWLASPKCAATSDGDCREVSKELWSLRALLANHSDISIEESVDEATTAETGTSVTTTPQSADDVSVKSSADTVVGVDDRPLPTTSTTAAQPPGSTTVTTAVADPQQQPSADAEPTNGGDDGVTRKPSIRRQNYREAIARRQNHRLQAAAAAAGSNELSIPTSSVEASSEPTDTESSLSFEWWTYASSNETTASSFGDSMTSTDSVGGGSVSDGHGGSHRLEQLRGDSGYRSLEAQQSLGQVRDFRRQSASHFLLDSSANVIYEDQMAMTTSADDIRAPVSASSVVVSVQQMQYSTAVGASIPVSLSTADAAASGSSNVRSAGHRYNKAAQRKRIQYRCERQAVEIHDSVAVGDPIEYKVTHPSHHHHHQYHHHHHHQPHHQQPHRRSTDAGSSAVENLAERGSMATTTTPTTATAKPSLFSRFLRTAHVGSGSSAGSSGIASRRMQRDYSIDERSNAIFNEFLRHDPAYDTKHTLSVHARPSRPRRSRISRSPMSSRSGRRRLAVEEHASSTLSTGETLPAEVQSQRLRDGSHTAPVTSATSPLLVRKHQLVEALADPRLSTWTMRETRRRSEGSNRFGTEVTAATVHATVNDPRRRASTSVDQSPTGNCRSSDAERKTSESVDTLSTQRRHDDAGADVPDDRPTTSQHSCQRRSAATSHRIPVIQLTTDEDTLQ